MSVPTLVLLATKNILQVIADLSETAQLLPDSSGRRRRQEEGPVDARRLGAV